MVFYPDGCHGIGTDLFVSIAGCKVCRGSGSELLVLNPAKEVVQGDTVNVQDTRERFQRDVRLSPLNSPVLDFRQFIAVSKCLDGRITFFYPQVCETIANVRKQGPESFV